MIAPSPGSSPSRSDTVKPPAVLPADRSLAFAQRTHETLNGNLVRCEERYPDNGPHSVLVVVVEREAAACKQKLSSLHAELFGPGTSDPLAPTALEIIDRATDEAIQRLIEAGLLSRTTRAARPLFPAEELSQIPPLSPEEQAKAGALRAQAARKLKMARLLGAGDLADEARPALLEALHGFGRALAIENRLPEPPDLQDVFLPPLARSWADSLPVLRAFANDPNADWTPAAEALSRKFQKTPE
jgi:hypothetical protein